MGIWLRLEHPEKQGEEGLGCIPLASRMWEQMETSHLHHFYAKQYVSQVKVRDAATHFAANYENGSVLTNCLGELVSGISKKLVQKPSGLMNAELLS